VPARLRKWKEENLRSGIRTAEGIDVFKRILAYPATQVVVSPVDLLAILEQVWNHAALADRRSDQSNESPAAEDIASQVDSEARPQIGSAYSAPTNDIEKKMVEIWEDLIGVKPVGIHDNFFELGGHSLMATQILSRIRDSYKIEVSMRAFFDATTISELCKRIAAMIWAERNQEAAKESADLESSEREELTL
jgi:acyl carrier protein